MLDMQKTMQDMANKINIVPTGQVRTSIIANASHCPVQGKTSQPGQNSCRNCGEVGHWKRDCPQLPPEERVRLRSIFHYGRRNPD